MKKTALLLLALAGLSPFATPAVHAAPKAAAPVVTPVTAPGLRKVIAERKNRVVLVNFWATWCTPCEEEFPALVKLQKTYAARGLSVVFVSADETRSRNSAVVPFLRKYGVKAASWIIQGDAFQFVPKFDPKMKGAFALPRTYIYDRKGKQVHVFSNAKTYGQFEKLIKPLL